MVLFSECLELMWTLDRIFIHFSNRTGGVFFSSKNVIYIHFRGNKAEIYRATSLILVLDCKSVSTLSCTDLRYILTFEI